MFREFSNVTRTVLAFPIDCEFSFDVITFNLDFKIYLMEWRFIFVLREHPVNFNLISFVFLFIVLDLFTTAMRQVSQCMGFFSSFLSNEKHFNAQDYSTFRYVMAKGDLLCHPKCGKRPQTRMLL